MNLVLDIGNTLLKVGLFKSGILINYYEFNENYYDNIENILETNQIFHSIVSNVSKSESKLIELLSAKTKLIYFDSSLKIVIRFTANQSQNFKHVWLLERDKITFVLSEI